MKKLLLTVALLAFSAGPAFAQYYPGNRPVPPPPQQQYQDHHNNRGPAYDRRGPRYDDRRGPRYDDRRGPRQRPRMCVTSRGDCPAPGYAGPGASCGCNLPGFGMKRGNVR